MSRIGKLPVNLPAGVTVEVAADNTVSVKGPLGTLSQKVDSDIKVEVGTHKDIHTGNEVPAVLVSRPTNQPRHRSLHGLYRALINNMVVGVSKGYEIKQELARWWATPRARRDRLRSPAYASNPNATAHPCDHAWPCHRDPNLHRDRFACRGALNPLQV